MPIATGVFKKLAIKKQVALGTTAAAGAAGTARYQRRVTSTLDLSKASYTSAEILESQQRRDMRHGVRSVAGSISGELSVGGYQPQFEAIMRQVAQTPATTGAIITVGAATSGAGTYAGTFTRSAGSFLTDGFKVGDVVRPLGYTTTGVDNNGKNFVITALTALVMTVRTLNQTDVAAKAAGDSVTISVAGRKTWLPASGQTRDYFTIEHWFSDVAQSEVFKDCVFTGATISLPATGLATVEFPVMALDQLPAGSTEYFTTPAASPAGPIVAAVNGVLIVAGVVVANITGLTITVNGNYSVPGGVVGSNTDPDVFPGPVDVSGSLTALFVNGTLRDQFYNETEGNIVAVLTGDNTAGAPFIAFNMPRTKLGGATKDDGTAGLSQTLPFTALENTAGGAAVNSLATTLSIQDSAFV